MHPLQKVLNATEFNTLQFGYRESVNDTDLPHILELPSKLPSLFASSAERAISAGFDGIELHYAHAYTMASFLSKTNMRKGGYGSNRIGVCALHLRCLRRVVNGYRIKFPLDVECSSMRSSIMAVEQKTPATMLNSLREQGWTLLVCLRWQV